MSILWPEIRRSQSDQSLAQSSASILPLKYRLFKKLIAFYFSFLGNEVCDLPTSPEVKNHPTNVNIDLYLYGHLILNFFEIFPVIYDRMPCFILRRSPLQISALRSAAETDVCAVFVDRCREMMQNIYGRTVLFSIICSSLCVNHSALQSRLSYRKHRKII